MNGICLLALGHLLLRDPYKVLVGRACAPSVAPRGQAPRPKARPGGTLTPADRVPAQGPRLGVVGAPALFGAAGVSAATPGAAGAGEPPNLSVAICAQA